MSKLANEMLDFYKQLDLTQEQYKILEALFSDNDIETKLDSLLSINQEDRHD